MSRISLSNISFVFPDGHPLFRDISVSFNNEVTGLTGSNGSGKSTLAKIAAGLILPSGGSVARPARIKYFEQEVFSSQEGTVASLLGIEAKFSAWLKIKEGNGEPGDFIELDDEWDIEERIGLALSRVGLSGLTGDTSAAILSGGETIRARLASLYLLDHDFIILDEPTNHLDASGRRAVYSFIEGVPRDKGVLIISHDRELLRRANRIVELSPAGIRSFGGNYDLYREVSDAERESAVRNFEERKRRLENDIASAKAAINDQTSRNNSAGKANRNSGIPAIMLGKMKSTGEKTLQKKVEAHRAKIARAQNEISEAEKKIVKEKKVTFDLIQGQSHASVVLACSGVSIFAGDNRLWSQQLNLTVTRGERLRITGSNGSGKSTFCRAISGENIRTEGEWLVMPKKVIYLDQKISFIDRSKSIIQNIIDAETGVFNETETRIRLGRLGFHGDDCHKLAGSLSGGELIRAAVGVLVSLGEPPGLLILDEPTNNLDLKGIEMLQSAVGNYPGTLIIITHDDDFAEGCGITSTLDFDDML